MAIYLGIDPGVSGAIAILDERGACLELLDMDPDFRLMRERFWADLWRQGGPWERDGEHTLTAVLEAAHAIPGGSAAANWTLCEAYTTARLLLEGEGIPYQVVTPPKWQNRICGTLPHNPRRMRGETRGEKLMRQRAIYGSRKQRKRAIFEFCRRRWPAAELMGPKGGVLDGRCDALCIGEYARLVIGKEAEDG